MKKILGIICTLVMVLGLVNTAAFAKDDSEAIPYADYKGLWYVENYTINSGLVYNATVTPDKGSTLNVWLENSQEVSLQVYETNWIGGYTKIYQNSFGAGVRDVEVKSNCNGKKYLVQLNRRADQTPTISLYVYQH